ncbi:MAG: N-acetylmuramoyl-L-alanine amidase [Akkermansiaceae bacterium]|nr:N-acetylmuramoyl-L-alanine amidase [Akkermansiaceae bacterium]
MKARHILPLLPAILPLLTPMPLHANEDMEWQATTLNGEKYYGLNLLRTFYKLTTSDKKGKDGEQMTRNSAFSLGLTPGKREATISGYRVRLSAPVAQDDSGELLVSETDFVKLIDPILRPTYINERRDIQTVILDPGHGGTDSGNKTPLLNESVYTLQLAQELAEELKKQGLNVVLTRNGNHDLSDTDRVEVAANCHNAIFISLHLNSGRSDVYGVETYTTAPLSAGKRAMAGNRYDAANAALAFALHSHMVAATKAPDRALRRAYYTLLNTMPCPAAMVMVGYCTHEKEAANLAAEAYRAELVKGLAAGIITFKNAIRPGAQITVPAAPKPQPPAPVAKPATPAPPKQATPPKKNSGSATKNKNTPPKKRSGSRNRRRNRR